MWYFYFKGSAAYPFPPQMIFKIIMIFATSLFESLLFILVIRGKTYVYFGGIILIGSSIKAVI